VNTTSDQGNWGWDKRIARLSASGFTGGVFAVLRHPLFGQFGRPTGMSAFQPAS